MNVLIETKAALDYQQLRSVLVFQVCRDVPQPFAQHQLTPVNALGREGLSCWTRPRTRAWRHSSGCSCCTARTPARCSVEPVHHPAWSAHFAHERLVDVASGAQFMYNEDDLFPSLLKALSDASDEVVRLDLLLLAQISNVTDADYFSRTIQFLCKQFNADRKARNGVGAEEEGS